MIGWIIRTCLHNRVLVLLITLLLCLLGGRALHTTAVDAIPDLSDVQVIIKTSYPGQAPNIVESQITRPLTSALLSVPGAHTVRGFSFFGDSFIYVIFKDGTDTYWARSRVLDNLNQAAKKLPPSASAEIGPDASGVGWVYIYALHSKNNQQDLAQLRALQDNFLRYELQTLPGVAEVAPIGGMVKEYHIQPDLNKLMLYGIPLMHIKNAVTHNNRETGLAAIELAEAETMLRATGTITSAASLGQTPLGIMDKNGAPLLLNQVAEIIEAPAMRRGLADLNGRGEVVGGIIVMRQGENAQKTIAAVKEKIAQITPALPAGVEVTPVYDRSQLISRAVNNLWHKLAQELILLGILLLVFLLSVRSVFAALITLPIGIVLSFLLMHWQGINANIMSLGGIAIALGAMVDGAIVMVENLQRRIATQKTAADHLQSVYDSAMEVGPTLFFSLLIVTISFMPIFTLDGEEGRLFRPLALTKTYAMASAALIAITLMPVVLYYLSGKLPAGHVHAARLHTHLLILYQRLLKRCLVKPTPFLLCVGFIGVAALMPLKFLASEFMPPLDEGDLMYMPTSAPGISIAKARELVQQTNKIISALPEVERVFGKAGRAETATDPAPISMLETFIQLKPRSQWRSGKTTADLIAELNSSIQFPGVSNAWVMPIKTRLDMLATGLKTPLGIKIAGPDINTLEQLGSQIESLLKELPQTRAAYSERSLGGRYLTLDINKQAAAAFGFSLDDIHEWLQMSLGAMPIGETIEGAERYAITLRFAEDYRSTPERIENLPIMGKNGVLIRLMDVAQVRLESGAHMLKSENGRLNNWIYIDIGDADVNRYVSDFNQRLQQQITWPTGYSLRWAGQYESMQRVRASLAFIIPLTLGIIALLLFVNFRSLCDVALLLASLPFALGGGLILVAALEFKFSVAVAVGFIALAGLSIATSALMLQVLRAQIPAQLNCDINSLHKQIIDTASLRLRP
ncbi:MAG TPA: CusA/CzcA family heavy metal efflux RND transporter, partial [Cellvibrionaceae bacterium]|nr:CusA/CzcA family heavy metal efflux RND transporter [Cellvibrionaceae bacterium]